MYNTHRCSQNGPRQSARTRCVCVDMQVGIVNGPARDGDRLSMPQAWLSILCHQAGQARPAGLATEATGPSTAAFWSRIATAARLPEQGSERGQWAVGTCACCKGATGASPAVRGRLASLLEIVCGCLGATRDRARVPFAYSLSLLIRSLR